MKAMSANIYTRFAKYMHTFATCIHLHKKSDLADYKVWWQPTINRPLQKSNSPWNPQTKYSIHQGMIVTLVVWILQKHFNHPKCQFRISGIKPGPSGSPVSNLASWRIPASTRGFSQQNLHGSWPVRGFSSLTLDQRPTAGRLTLGKLHLAPKVQPLSLQFLQGGSSWIFRKNTC